MMGKAVAYTDIPVTKGTSGILIIPSSKARRKAPSDCIRCAKCIHVCPMGLNPTLLMNLSSIPYGIEPKKTTLPIASNAGHAVTPARQIVPYSIIFDWEKGK